MNLCLIERKLCFPHWKHGDDLMVRSWFPHRDLLGLIHFNTIVKKTRISGKNSNQFLQQMCRQDFCTFQKGRMGMISVCFSAKLFQIFQNKICSKKVPQDKVLYLVYIFITYLGKFSISITLTICETMGETIRDILPFCQFKSGFYNLK